MASLGCVSARLPLSPSPSLPSSSYVCSSLPTAKHRNDGLRGDNEGLEEEEEEEEEEDGTPGRPRPKRERLTLANTFQALSSVLSPLQPMMTDERHFIFEAAAKKNPQQFPWSVFERLHIYASSRSRCTV